MAIPDFPEYSLVEAAQYLSSKLPNNYLPENIESLVKHEHLVACVRLGDRLLFLYEDGVTHIFEGSQLVVAETKTKLANSDVVYFDSGVLKAKNIVFLKSELDSFLKSQETGNDSEADPQFEEPPKPLQREAARQQVILHALEELGYNPLALPVSAPGKSGVRKKVRDYLDAKGANITDNTFKKAWQTLRKNGETLVVKV